MEVKGWVQRVHDALHSTSRWAKPRKSATVNGKHRPIKPGPCGIRYLDVGQFRFSVTTEGRTTWTTKAGPWGALAQAGKRVTLITTSSSGKPEIYGAIVENKVFRQIDNEVELVGILGKGGGNSDQNRSTQEVLPGG